MILKASYGGQAKDGSSSDFNPYFGTDVGICSIIKPQLSFNKSLDDLPFWTKLFQVYLVIQIHNPLNHGFLHFPGK